MVSGFGFVWVVLNIWQKEWVMNRSYYQNGVVDFLHDSNNEILGKLANQHEFDLTELQRNAWTKQVALLKTCLLPLQQGRLYFEFAIPRMGKRVDNILLIHDLILVIEFKVGAEQYPKHAKTQVIDYCLDLLNFHAGSHGQKVVPILVSTQASDAVQDWDAIKNLKDSVCCHGGNLTEVLQQTIEKFSTEQCIGIAAWEAGAYKPTPTIIEAAQALYKGHGVAEISRHDAGATNLAITAIKINQIIDQAKNNQRKVICFVTGVPGAGKTLAGLNIANERLHAHQDEHAVFLSGNGPLVDVLRESLVRNTVQLAKEAGMAMTRKSAEQGTKAFIQNIHHFRDEYLDQNKVPLEKVVVFDEAQRAWNKEQASAFMQKKKGIVDFSQSEPEYLIGVMDRHGGWCVVVCLIGGGQEINTGEAGISEWLNALQNRFQHWQVFYSNKIHQETVYLDNGKSKQWLTTHATSETDLHLAMSLRSFRSEFVSVFVQHVLDGDAVAASQVFEKIQKAGFPICLSRDLGMAKRWLKEQVRGSERFGIVASSGGRRLRADAIDVKNKMVAENWFLDAKDDVRSSFYMEDVATEFDIQGLEIDYTCVAWDINFYYQNGWQCQSFSGSSWKKMNHPWKQKYLLNAYRVLLTRARQGMVVYVPKVDGSDHTRPQDKYDATFDFLQSCGLNVIE